MLNPTYGMPRSALLVCGAALLTAMPAEAAIHVLTATYDPAALTPSTVLVQSLGQPITLGLGDTVDLTIRFTGGVSVAFPSNFVLSSGLYTHQAGTVRTDTALSFTNPSPNIHSASDQQNNGFSSIDYLVAGHYEWLLYRSDTNLLPENAPPVSFTAMRNVFTISAVYSGAATRSFDRVYFYFAGETPVAGAAAASLPEPSSWATMIAGFGAIGAGLRRRKPDLTKQSRSAVRG
jgi:hypothetical protein